MHSTDFPTDFHTIISASIEGIYASASVAQAFYKQINGSEPFSMHDRGETFYGYPCNASKPNIALTWSNVNGSETAGGDWSISEYVHY